MYLLQMHQDVIRKQETETKVKSQPAEDAEPDNDFFLTETKPGEICSKF